MFSALILGVMTQSRAEYSTTARTENLSEVRCAGSIRKMSLAKFTLAAAEGLKRWWNYIDEIEAEYYIKKNEIAVVLNSTKVDF